MDRKSLIFSAVLAVSITLNRIPITAQQRDAQRGGNTPNLKSDSPRQQQRQKPDRQPNLPDSLVSPAPPHETPSPVEQTENSKRESNYWDEWRHDAFRASTIAQLVLAFIGIWGGCLALSSLKRLSEQTAATKRAAVAASSSAKTANIAMRTGQRAYVDVVNIKIVSLKPTEPFRFRFDIANAGATPALILGSKTHIDFQAIPMPPASALPPAPTYEGVAGAGPTIPIRPRGQFPKFFDNNPVLGNDKYDAILKQQIALIVRGFIDYRDVFGAEYRRKFGFHFDVATSQFIFPVESGYNVEIQTKEPDDATG
jgi:hypothetical protein